MYLNTYCFILSMIFFMCKDDTAFEMLILFWTVIILCTLRTSQYVGCKWLVPQPSTTLTNCGSIKCIYVCVYESCTLGWICSKQNWMFKVYRYICHDKDMNWMLFQERSAFCWSLLVSITCYTKVPMERVFQAVPADLRMKMEALVQDLTNALEESSRRRCGLRRRARSTGNLRKERIINMSLT